MNTHVFRHRGNLFSRAAQAAGLLGLLALIPSLAAMATPNAAAPANAAAPVSAAAPASATNRYIGVEECKTCHKSAEAGNQYGKWSKTWHAKTFETLAEDDAKEVAKAKGIDDPQKSGDCLKCHVTAFGVPADAVAPDFKPELGVQCESCHGPGEVHQKARIAAAAKRKGAAAAATEVADGEIIRKPNMDTCLKCHNPESPTYKSFCYKEMHALIVHVNPKKQRSDDEMKALMNPFGCTDTECKCPKPAAASDAGSQPAPPAQPAQPAQPPDTGEQHKSG